jgi:hypothetical protein
MFGMDIDGGIDQIRHLFNVKRNDLTSGCQPNILTSQLFSKTLTQLRKVGEKTQKKAKELI